MAVGCGASCAKFMLILFNFIFWVSKIFLTNIEFLEDDGEKKIKKKFCCFWKNVDIYFFNSVVFVFLNSGKKNFEFFFSVVHTCTIVELHA